MKDAESAGRLRQALAKVEENQLLYSAKKRDEIREFFYENGVDITYKRKNKDGTTSIDTTIHYEMLFRTSAKAKSDKWYSSTASFTAKHTIG